LRLNYTKLKEHLPAFKSELPIKSVLSVSPREII
jgi:hypothetical protein